MFLTKVREKSIGSHWLWVQIVLSIMIFALLAGPAFADDDEDDQLFGATTIIIELTDNDIELQAFVDGVEWKSLQIFAPNERRIFNLRTKKNIRQQGGLSELFFASEPTHYLEDEPDFDGTIEEFLSRFPAGEYEIEGRTVNGGELEGQATLTHVLPALPEIIAPVSDGEDPPVVNPNNLIIEWEPVTTRFIGNGPVEIFEYQVIFSHIADMKTCQPQIFDVFGMKGGINHSECAAHAHPHQVDLFYLGFRSDPFDGPVGVIIDIVIQIQVPIGAGRIAPINQINIQPLLEKILNKASARFQIQHDVAIDQRINDQNRRSMNLPFARQPAIMEQPHLVL